MDGKADSISGLETPDPLTLVVHEVRPDTTLPYEFTLVTTAPIPTLTEAIPRRGTASRPATIEAAIRANRTATGSTSSRRGRT